MRLIQPGAECLDFTHIPFGVPRLRGAGEARGEPPEGGTPSGRNHERACKALPWWKREFTPEPQPAEGI